MSEDERAEERKRRRKRRGRKERVRQQRRTPPSVLRTPLLLSLSSQLPLEHHNSISEARCLNLWIIIGK
jgi:hypothetical protein